MNILAVYSPPRIVSAETSENDKGDDQNEDSSILLLFLSCWPGRRPECIWIPDCDAPTRDCVVTRYTHEGLEISHQFRGRLSVNWCAVQPTLAPPHTTHIPVKTPGDGRQSHVSHFLSPSPGLTALSQAHACLVAAFYYFVTSKFRC